jgi:glycosyltransferase involved in cell wall biosynthesis
MRHAFLVANKLIFHERFNINNIDILIRLGFKVHLVSNNYVKVDSINRYNEFMYSCNTRGVKLHDIKIPRNPFNIFMLMDSIFHLRKIIKAFNPVIIHSHTPSGGLVGRLASVNSNSEIIYTAHGFHFNPNRRSFDWFLYFPIEFLLAKITDKIIMINTEDYLYFSKIYPLKSYYVPGVGYREVCKNTLLDSSNLKNQKTFKLLSIGELNHNKNHIFIVRALSKLNISIEYTILGTGKNLVKLQKLKSRLKNGNLKLNILGYVEDIKSHVCDSDIVVHSSIREGLPVSVMECMSCNKPVLASNIRGNRDLITDGEGGYLFDPKNQHDFIRALSLIIENRQEWIKMGEINKNNLQKFNDQKVVSILTKLYNGRKL